jgi:hypothetical protein
VVAGATAEPQKIDFVLKVSKTNGMPVESSSLSANEPAGREPDAVDCEPRIGTQGAALPQQWINAMGSSCQ